MKKNKPENIEIEASVLLSQIYRTIEKQIAHLQNDQMLQSQKCSDEITEMSVLASKRGVFKDPKFSNEISAIMSSYDKLSVILTSHKELTAQQLEKLSVGRRVVSAYATGA